MTLLLTADMLREAGACESGLAAFEAAFPGGYYGPWTRDTLLETLRSPLRAYLGWGFENHLIPMWSLRFADLRNADLSGADLSGADLRGADLNGADLRNAGLNGADLSGAIGYVPS